MRIAVTYDDNSMFDVRLKDILKSLSTTYANRG